MESLRELLLGDNFSCPTCVCQCSTEVLDLSPPFGTFVRLWTSFPKRPARPPFRRRVVRGRQWPVDLPFPLRVCVCGPGEENVLRALDRRSSTRSAVSRLCKASSPPPLRLCLRSVCGHRGQFLECEWRWFVRVNARTLNHSIYNKCSDLAMYIGPWPTVVRRFICDCA